MELETDIVNNASGSARLRLANSDILVGVKTEVDVPFADKFNEGKIEFFVDCSANATPEFEGRGGEELGTEIAHMLSKSYQSPNAFDLKKLCILEHTKYEHFYSDHKLPINTPFSVCRCWKLYVDILILECGGNLFDAVSIAVKAALYNTKIPKVTAAAMDGGSVELDLSDDPHDCDRLNVDSFPLLVTVCKIGDHCLVDPSAEEEECSLAKLVIGVSCNANRTTVTATRTAGSGSFHQNTLKESLRLGRLAGEGLSQELLKILQVDEKKNRQQKLKMESVGFLK